MKPSTETHSSLCMVPRRGKRKPSGGVSFSAPPAGSAKVRVCAVATVVRSTKLTELGIGAPRRAGQADRLEDAGRGERPGQGAAVAPRSTGVGVTVTAGALKADGAGLGDHVTGGVVGLEHHARAGWPG